MFKQKKTKPLISKAKQGKSSLSLAERPVSTWTKADLEEYERVMLDIYEDVYHASELADLRTTGATSSRTASLSMSALLSLQACSSLTMIRLISVWTCDLIGNKVYRCRNSIALAIVATWVHGPYGPWVDVQSSQCALDLLCEKRYGCISVLIPLGKLGFQWHRQRSIADTAL